MSTCCRASCICVVRRSWISFFPSSLHPVKAYTHTLFVWRHAVGVVQIDAVRDCLCVDRCACCCRLRLMLIIVPAAQTGLLPLYPSGDVVKSQHSNGHHHVHVGHSKGLAPWPRRRQRRSQSWFPLRIALSGRNGENHADRAPGRGRCLQLGRWYRQRRDSLDGCRWRGLHRRWGMARVVAPGHELFTLPEGCPSFRPWYTVPCLPLTWRRPITLLRLHSTDLGARNKEPLVTLSVASFTAPG